MPKGHKIVNSEICIQNVDFQPISIIWGDFRKPPFFNFPTIRENKKLGGKKNVSSVFTQYVCFFVYVCLCVCLSVAAI